MEEYAALAKLVAADEGAADGSGMQDAGFLLPSTSRRVAVSIEQLKPEVLRDWVDKVTKDAAAAHPLLLRLCRPLLLFPSCCASAAHLLRLCRPPLPSAASTYRCCSQKPVLPLPLSAASSAVRS